MNFSEKKHLSLKTGEEGFSFENCSMDFNLLDFWRWSVSDILSNATRGILAEFIVAKALDADVAKTRNEWDAYDLITPEGIKVEVKSSAYLQSWEQVRYSEIKFSTRETRPWDWSIDKRSQIPVRSADVYVFCLLNHLDKATVNPLNLDQWEFYIVHSKTLKSNSITLKSLKKISGVIKFTQIKSEITKLQSIIQ